MGPSQLLLTVKSIIKSFAIAKDLPLYNTTHWKRCQNQLHEEPAREGCRWLPIEVSIELHRNFWPNEHGALCLIEKNTNMAT